MARARAGVIPGQVVGRWPLSRLLASLFALVVVVSLLPVAVLDSLNTATILRNRALDSELLIARRTADRLDEYLNALLTWGRDFSNRPAIRTWLEEGAYGSATERARWEQEILLPFRHRWNLPATFVAAPGGRMILQSGNLVLPAALAGWPPFLQASAGREAVSNVFTDSSGETAYLSVLVPIRHPGDGRTVAVVGVEDTLGNLRRLVAKDKGAVGPGSFGLLLDDNAIRLVHGSEPALEGVPADPLPVDVAASLRAERPYGSRTAQLFERASRIPELPAKLAELQSNPGASPFVHAFMPTAGERGHGALVPLKTKAWFYYLGAPDGYFLAPIRRQLGQAALILAGVLLAVSMLSWTLARWVTRPVQGLGAAALAMERGDLSARAELTGSRELASLGSAFNQMAGRLQRFTQSLEDEVRERTAQLVRVNADLRDSEERLHTLVSCAPVILIAIDRDGVFSFLEGKAPGALGLEPADVLGRTVREVYREYPDLQEVFSRALAGEITGSLVEFGGATFDIRFSSVPSVPDGAGGVAGTAGVVAVATDVTERKRLDDALKAQNVKLQELDSIKNQFVNAVSHDLRTPLTTILGYTEFLEDGLGGALSSGQADFVRQIQLATARLGRLVDDLLDFARLESGTFRLSVAQADLVAKVNEIAEGLRPLAGEARVALAVEVAEDSLELPMDAQRIGQVLTNLIHNAIKFTPEGGRVRVRAYKADDHAVCEVQDTGIGIAKDDMARLFRQFSQLEGGRQKGGTGLGLSIARSIVEAHGGAIGVTSEGPGSGSTFWFRLPAPLRGAAAPGGELPCSLPGPI